MCSNIFSIICLLWVKHFPNYTLPDLLELLLLVSCFLLTSQTLHLVPRTTMRAWDSVVFSPSAYPLHFVWPKVHFFHEWTLCSSFSFRQNTPSPYNTHDLFKMQACLKTHFMCCYFPWRLPWESLAIFYFNNLFTCHFFFYCSIGYFKSGWHLKSLQSLFLKHNILLSSDDFYGLFEAAVNFLIRICLIHLWIRRSSSYDSE